jgi:hypothetical protein
LGGDDQGKRIEDCDGDMVMGESIVEVGRRYKLKKSKTRKMLLKRESGTKQSNVMIAKCNTAINNLF